MTGALLTGVLAASFLGSLHCVAMCGPFVAVYSGLEAQRARFASHAAYHLGRLITYVVLGAVAGVVGRAVDLAGSAAGVARISAVLAGFLMMLFGLAALLEMQGVRLLPGLGLSAPRRALASVLARLDAKPRLLRALVVGLSTTLLPCGWLYAFAVTAAGTGSLLGGMAVMGAFWLGSVPLLFTAGVGFGALSAKLRRHVPTLTAVLLIAIGLATVVTRINVPSFAVQTMIAPEEAPCPYHVH
jgi:sulfite exporter TauE/SafE